jgi:hypothetical protein
MAMIVAVAVGLISRQGIFPTPLGKYPGDAFWAMMVYCGLGCLWPQLKPLPRAASALWLSYGVELSQLFHTDWLDRFRGTMLGHLMLGHGFQWVDLVAYSVGVVGGFWGERALCWLITQRSHCSSPDRVWQRRHGRF